VWLGTGRYVLKGVTVSRGQRGGERRSAFSIAAGVPAKVVKALEPPPEGLDALLARLRKPS